MKTVALVDWNWGGHHPMWFQKITKGFVSTGARVVALCPPVAVDGVQLDNRGKNDVFVESCRYCPPQHRLPSFLRARESARKTFGGLEKSLAKWEHTKGAKIDLVFFSTIYDFEFENFHRAKRWFQRPWSGVYLHARAFRMPGTPMPYVNRMPCPETIFTQSSMSSVCLIDEGAVAPMRTLTAGKPVFEFPDITGTEVDLPLDGSNLAGKLLRFAAGRKIVVCLGHLQKTKGLLELCRVARDDNAKKICFFFGGDVNWGDLTASEVDFIRATWEQSPNVLTHLTRVLSDSTLNALIKVSDVVFAAYTNFPNSSNIMTKAAFLEKPIIVSDGHLMAERVRQHRLGSIVPEGSVPDILREICQLCEHGGASDADYMGYYAKHSPKALQAALVKVLDAVPG